MNALSQHNARHRLTLEATRDRLIADRAARPSPPYGDYALPRLRARIAEALSARWGQGVLDPQLDIIERDKLGGDLALKLPQLLKAGGPKAFIAEHLPWVVEVLSGAGFADAIARVDVKGMYVNLTLTDRWLFAAGAQAAAMGGAFGLSDAQAGRTVLADYSSPNVAKVLHAGHIRSTIIGHVLCNLHDACGALVYRVNHINDFGGFGFTLEGWRRFAGNFPPGMSNGERLLEIYRIRRALEQGDDAALIARYFPGDGAAEARAAFTAASDARFSALETGDADEVALWAEMVEWSLADFQQFYDALGIHIDLVMGESFYFEAGDAVVDSALKTGTALQYAQADADADTAALPADLSDAERAQRTEAIAKDIGAVVVPLPEGGRYVVRRADGRSIYATRDLGAVVVRRDLYDPTDMVYIVGQEQRVHFDRLFRAAQAMGIAGDVHFNHIWFGFYVDAKTNKKLSSRDSVASVNTLLERSVDYFRARVAERGDQSEAEVDEAARQLARGSLVFNDLKQDIKGAVEIDAHDLDATIAGFERSGGAYMVYTACRARSILRKAGIEPPAADTLAFLPDAQAVTLLLQIAQLPEKITEAAAKSNPTVLIRHLLDLGATYNSWYTRVPVIVDGRADPALLLITQAVQRSLTAALKLCHIECPPKI